MDKKRCYWVNLQNQESLDYHDHEWGVPLYDDQSLFEMLTLEGAQAGLSWETVLKKRPHYQQAFAHFEIEKVAAMTDQDLEKHRQNPGLIRHRLKLASTRQNAKVVLALQKEFSSFAAYLWSFVDNKPIVGHWEHQDDVPVTTAISHALSKDLQKRGMSFVGSTIIYAYMQAIGMVNDHLVSCFRYKE